jgi:hypothetical protein
MAEIIKQREKKTDVSYELCFYEKATNEVVWDFHCSTEKEQNQFHALKGKK